MFKSGIDAWTPLHLECADMLRFESGDALPHSKSAEQD
jgi:hypothetical protein